MNVGVIKFSLHLPGNQSLKGKRKVITSLMRKIGNQFHVSIAEVEQNDNLKVAVIGISLVSNSVQILQQVISQILSFLQTNSGEYVLEDFTHNIMRA